MPPFDAPLLNRAPRAASRGPRPPHRKKFLFESLESRLLLSADLAPTAQAALSTGLQELKAWSDSLVQYSDLAKALPVVNTTIGGVGFFDVADEWLGWKESPEDFGQTLAVYGVPSGPYLMLPFYGPSNIRDTVGFVADGAMNPMTYFLSTLQLIAVRGGTTMGSAINYRSLNLELFEDVNRYTVDLYGAVQDGYQQKREKQIAE